MSLSELRAVLITDPLILLSTAVMGSVSLLASLIDSRGKLQHAVAREWGRMLLRISGVKVQVEGLERIDPGRNYVVVANHASYMDIPVILAHLPLQIRFLAKKSLFSIPFLGWHLRRAGHIPVLREDARASLKSMTAAAHRIREEHISAVLFPEGGRSPVSLREFKEGAAYVAIKAGALALPVALVGTRDVLPMGSLIVRGAQVRLRIGEPISTSGLTIKDRARFTALFREKIEELLSAGEGTRGLV